MSEMVAKERWKGLNELSLLRFGVKGKSTFTENTQI